MSISIKDALARVAFTKDGSDHILLAPFAATQLGKYSCMGWRKPFFIPALGEFISPLAFMAWLYTGDESQRHAAVPTRMTKIPKQELAKYVMSGYLAKWFQLCSMNGALVKHSGGADSEIFNVPWVEYKIHASGLKEFPRDQNNANILKALVHHNVKHGNKDGLKSLDSSIIPDFNRKEVQTWINEMVREKFNLGAPVESVPQEVKSAKKNGQHKQKTKVEKPTPEVSDDQLVPVVVSGDEGLTATAMA